MSHLKERAEKNCLNCNTQVVGKYCHVCGQENIEPKETAWHLFNHFFEDITHFDGKFFSTLWLLISMPGFLSAEYARGRRASYLNPIRMYLFTSAIFFLIFFSVFKIKNDDIILDASTINGKTFNEVSGMDSLAFATFTRNINREDKKPDIPMTREQFKNYYDSAIDNSGLSLTKRHYKSVKEYDSLIKAGIEKDNWFEQKLQHRQIEINRKYQNNPRSVFSNIGEVLLHKLPQMLFISLPLLALLLKMLYARRKEFYYVNHGIFSLHIYIFIFIALLFSFGLGELHTRLNWGILSLLRTILTLAMFFYVYKAMKNFYGQGSGKTLVKFTLLIILFLLIIVILFSAFLLFSIFTV